MRLGKLFFAIFLSSAPLCLLAQEADVVASALERMQPYAASVSYSITLPQAEDDIVYSVALQSVAPGSWLIDWNVPEAGQAGWTAQFEGSFYNFRNRRLQEIHSGWDKQNPPRAQFADLLPERIAAQLREMAADPTRYAMTVKNSGGELTVEADRLTSGQVDAELSWTFDSQTFRPLKFSADYNPGAISSQQISATYSPAEPTLPQAFDETYLRERYPDAFTNHRQSNFAIEHMRGEPLPAFSLLLASGKGRLTRQAGEAFRQPTLVVLLESQSALAPELVRSIRKAIDCCPTAAEVIWACAERNPDSAADLLGELREGETALIGAKSLAADCGAAALPVIMVCGTDGTVKNLSIGLNKETQTDVIQMIMKL